MRDLRARRRCHGRDERQTKMNALQIISSAISTPFAGGDDLGCGFAGCVVFPASSARLSPSEPKTVDKRSSFDRLLSVLFAFNRIKPRNWIVGGFLRLEGAQGLEIGLSGPGGHIGRQKHPKGFASFRVIFRIKSLKKACLFAFFHLLSDKKPTFPLPSQPGERPVLSETLWLPFPSKDT